MEEQLCALLIAAVGSSVPVAWGFAKPGQKTPHITLSPIGADANYSTDGPSTLSTSNVQIDIWAKSFTEMRDIKRKVKLVVNGVTHNLNPIELVFVDSERYMPSADPSNPYHRLSLDCTVWHHAD